MLSKDCLSENNNVWYDTDRFSNLLSANDKHPRKVTSTGMDTEISSASAQ